MSQIARKYNFQAGKKIKSAEANEEFNQLVAGHNDLDARVVDTYSKTDVDAAIAEAMLGNTPINSINGNLLVDGTVAGGKLASGAVTMANLADDVFTSRIYKVVW